MPLYFHFFWTKVLGHYIDIVFSFVAIMGSIEECIVLYKTRRYVVIKNTRQNTRINTFFQQIIKYAYNTLL